MEKISILTPTRDRVSFCAELIKTCVLTSDHPKELEFVFYIDNDDNASKEYFDELVPYLESRDESGIKIVTGDRIVLSETLNKCMDVAEGDILFHCGDDIRFRTQGWDTIVRNKFDEFDDKIVFVFGTDGVHPPGSFGTHGFIHRKWVEAVGYFVPPYFSSDYNDTWLNDVGKDIKRYEHIDIYTEHMHPVANKHFWDNTHLERMERHRNDNVDTLYDELEPKRKEDAEKLLDAIKSHSE